MITGAGEARLVVALPSRSPRSTSTGLNESELDGMPVGGRGVVEASLAPGAGLDLTSSVF